MQWKPKTPSWQMPLQHSLSDVHPAFGALHCCAHGADTANDVTGVQPPLQA